MPPTTDRADRAGTDRHPAGPPLRRSPRRPGWLKPLRRTVLVLVVLLVLEYLVAPRLIGATKDLDVLGRLQPEWVVAGVGSEVACLGAYAMMLRAVLPPGQVRLPRLMSIVLATTALGHVVPASAAGSAGLGYRLLTTSGVDGSDAGFAWVTASLGSAVVLNVVLWLSLLVSIPLAGFHPVYVVAALLGLLAVTVAAALTYTFTNGELRAVRAVRVVGRWLPRVGPDRLEGIVRDLADSLAHLAADRRLLLRVGGWAAANWLLDAAALWCFLAALGNYTEPFELFAAYGIANVLAVIPITPGGLGIIDATTPALLVSFGVAKTTATFGVLGWRLVNFWLPIPTGAAAYLLLHLPHDADAPGS